MKINLKSKTSVLIVVILLILGLKYVVADLSPTELEGPYEVVKVSDGDTIVVDIHGKDVKVRMIGIDTPESVHQDESKNTEEGRIASDFVKDLLLGEMVYLEYDVEPTDQYGRTLAYVYLDDKETMVEDLLLKKGYATKYNDKKNTRHYNHFSALQDKAQEDCEGFWGTGFLYTYKK